jgi:hypothetical protein
MSTNPRIRPKSMSTEEANEWIANPGQPPEDAGLEQLRAVLAQVASGIDPDTGDQLAEPEAVEAYTEPDGYLAVTTPRMQTGYLVVKPSEDVPSESPEVHEDQQQLRSMTDLDADIDTVCGPNALGVSPQIRHHATLRLVDDLIEARILLESFSQALSGMAPRS